MTWSLDTAVSDIMKVRTVFLTFDHCDVGELYADTNIFGNTAGKRSG